MTRCPDCNGTLRFLARIGDLYWYRCNSCGEDANTDIQTLRAAQKNQERREERWKRRLQDVGIE